MDHTMAQDCTLFVIFLGIKWWTSPVANRLQNSLCKLFSHNSTAFNDHDRFSISLHLSHKFAIHFFSARIFKNYYFKAKNSNILCLATWLNGKNVYFLMLSHWWCSCYLLWTWKLEFCTIIFKFSFYCQLFQQATIIALLTRCVSIKKNQWMSLKSSSFK